MTARRLLGVGFLHHGRLHHSRYTPDPIEVADSFSRIGADSPARPQGNEKHDHTFCLSQTYQGAVYLTGPFETSTSVSLYPWQVGFTQYLKQKYSFQGGVDCNVETPTTSQRLVDARKEGARAQLTRRWWTPAGSTNPPLIQITNQQRLLLTATMIASRRHGLQPLHRHQSPLVTLLQKKRLLR